MYGFSLFAVNLFLIFDVAATSASTKNISPQQTEQKTNQKKLVPTVSYKTKASSQRWYTDYATAYHAATKQKKMLFIYFYDPRSNAIGKKYEQQVLASRQIQKELKTFLLVRLPVDYQFTTDNKKTKLLSHDSFEYMYGREGISIIDLQHSKKAYYGHVVSSYSFSKKFQYNVAQTKTILNLPPGTITQRTMVYAVRVHHEAPLSTNGKSSAMLFTESSNHSQHQADINLQGHHNWESRFQQISHQLGDGMLATEVCAESWPDEELVEAAVECVYCWRQSSGHWSSVSRFHPRFGYDMRRGSNRIWYATGIFGHR